MTFRSSRTLPGQLVRLQDQERVLPEPLGPPPVLARELGHEVLGQAQDVVAALPQRRHVDRDDVEPEIEILAEAPGPDLLDQILVRRRDHAHVHADARRPAHRLDHLLLQRAQHLGLRLQAHVADFVEEQGAAGRHLELAAAVGDGAGEGAARVAEQLGLDQLLGDGGAVHLDERGAVPVAERMNLPRDQLLARPVLAGNQHAAVGRRRHRDLLAQPRITRLSPMTVGGASTRARSACSPPPAGAAAARSGR